MLKQCDLNKLIKYWLDGSEYDLKVCNDLFKTKKYPYSLFFLHLSLEKLIKALVVKFTKAHSPYKHNLLKLLDKTDIKLDKTKVSLINSINEFNIEARYPDVKKKLYKKATKAFSKNYIQKGKDLRKWLKKELNKK